MKGCDFCSKDRSGGFVVLCSLQVCYLKHNSISLILCTVLLQGPISVSDFPINPQKIKMQQQHDRKLNHSMTIHYLSQIVGIKFSFWNMPLLSLFHVYARDSLSVQEVAETEGRKHSVVCLNITGQKLSPECMKMYCDKIYFAFLFQ